MAGRMVCAIALGIPVLAGLAYLGLSGAPFVYIASNGLALVVALAATAFLRVRLSDRQCRILSVLLLLLLYVPLLTGPHLNGIARWLPLGPVALHAGALALPALVVLAARDEDYAPPILLAALLADLPCDVMDLGIVSDELDAMTAAFVRATQADIIVSTGGASVGDHDLVRPAFAAAGGTLDFWKIRMRPGKPLMAGTLDKSLFIGLPGNPVSAFVTGALFLLPLVRHLSGAGRPLPFLTDAALASPLPATGDRDDYLRAWRGIDGVVSVTSQDSAATAAMAKADCLILRPAQSPPAQPGDRVTILPL